MNSSCSPTTPSPSWSRGSSCRSPPGRWSWRTIATARTSRAGYVYLVMASFGTLALLLAFGLLAGPDGAYAFDAIRAADHPRRVAALRALSLSLLGAGSKAGLVPLHVWLPLAHPAAPSHVSALMSGVMTKVAVYGFIRIVFDLLGPPTGGGAWSCWRSAASPPCSAALRADAARSEAPARLPHGREYRHHLHRPRACARLPGQRHGLGRRRWRSPPALFHVFNHCAVQEPAVLRRRRRAAPPPASATWSARRPDPPHAGRPPSLFLVGCVAISALPPLNGFVSEWLTFQAILLSPAAAAMGPEARWCRRSARCWRCRRRSPPPASSRPSASPSSAAPRSPRPRARARGRPLLARGDVRPRRRSACLAGILPGLVIDALAPAVQSAGRRPHAGAGRPALALDRADRREPQLLQRPARLPVHRRLGARSPPSRSTASPRDALRRAPAWDCGFPDPSPATQYTAGSFAQPIRRVFGTRRVPRPRAGRDAAARAIRAPARFTVDAARSDLGRALRADRRRRRLRRRPAQPSAVPHHPPLLSLVFVALVVLLLVLALWP